MLSKSLKTYYFRPMRLRCKPPAFWPVRSFYFLPAAGNRSILLRPYGFQITCPTGRLPVSQKIRWAMSGLERPGVSTATIRRIITSISWMKRILPAFRPISSLLCSLTIPAVCGLEPGTEPPCIIRRQILSRPFTTPLPLTRCIKSGRMLQEGSCSI